MLPQVADHSRHRVFCDTTMQRKLSSIDWNSRIRYGSVKYWYWVSREVRGYFILASAVEVQLNKAYESEVRRITDCQDFCGMV